MFDFIGDAIADVVNFFIALIDGFFGIFGINI